MSMIGAYLVAVFVLLALYQVLTSRLQMAAQPHRLRLANDGENLLQNPDLSLRARRHVQFLLSTAFGMRRYLLAGIGLIPIMALIAFFYPRLISDIGIVSLSEDPNTAIRFRNLCRLHHTITVANNPILRLIVALEMTLFLTPALTIRSSIDGVLSPGPGAEAMIVAIGEMVTERRIGFVGAGGSAC